MIHYTIGALFTKDFGRVLIIKKLKPEWQNGMLNLPGGKLEEIIHDRVIPNLYWLIPFAMNTWKQGKKADEKLTFGTFKYTNV